MDYNDELMRYQNDAEDHFDDYDTDMDYEEDFDTGFEGNEDAFDEYLDDEDFEEDFEEDDIYDDYTSTSIGKIDPNDRTLTVRITNTSDTAGEAIVFGGNEEAAQPAGVSVVVGESSHKVVREESKSNPFQIVGMKYSVSDPLQFDNVLQLINKTATGSNTIRVYQPRNATSPQNFTQNLIDDDNFELSVTGRDSLRLLINANTTAVFTFTVRARTNIGNVLKGSNVAELSRSPRITGLPQIDLLRRQRPKSFGVRSRRGGGSRKPIRVLRRPSSSRSRRVRSRGIRPKRYGANSYSQRRR